MYRGKRDPYVDIIVSQKFCETYIGQDGREWVEIYVPRSQGAPYEWGTIMVRPEQVFAVDDEYNLVQVNNFAQIVNSTKETNTHAVLDSETMTPYMIIGALLKYELKSDLGESACFNAYTATGMKLYDYIMRNRPKP